jgi:serine/threonine protein kinase
LIDSTGNPRISDFGVAILGDLTKGRDTTTGSNGSEAWMAPERLKDQTTNRKSKAMDVYAFACICYMVSGENVILVLTNLLR